MGAFDNWARRLVGAAQRDQAQQVLGRLDFAPACDMRIQSEVMVVKEAPCSDVSAWVVRCRYCEVFGLVCDRHMVALSLVVSVTCASCLVTTETQVGELYEVSPIGVRS